MGGQAARGVRSCHMAPGARSQPPPPPACADMQVGGVLACLLASMHACLHAHPPCTHARVEGRKEQGASSDGCGSSAGAASGPHTLHRPPLWHTAQASSMLRPCMHVRMALVHGLRCRRVGAPPPNRHPTTACARGPVNHSAAWSRSCLTSWSHLPSAWGPEAKHTCIPGLEPATSGFDAGGIESAAEHVREAERAASGSGAGDANGPHGNANGPSAAVAAGRSGSSAHHGHHGSVPRRPTDYQRLRGAVYERHLKLKVGWGGWLGGWSVG